MNHGQETGLCLCGRGLWSARTTGKAQAAYTVRIYSAGCTGLGMAGGSRRVGDARWRLCLSWGGSRGRDGLIAAGASDWRLLKRVFRSEAVVASHTLHFPLLLSHLPSPRQRPSHLPAVHSYNACRTCSPPPTRPFPARPSALTGQTLLCLPLSPLPRTSQRALLPSRT